MRDQHCRQCAVLQIRWMQREVFLISTILWARNTSLQNERSLTDSELFYILCWHYINLAALSANNFWQLTFDVDKKTAVCFEAEKRDEQSYSESKVTGGRRRCGGKVESSFLLKANTSLLLGSQWPPILLLASSSKGITSGVAQSDASYTALLSGGGEERTLNSIVAKKLARNKTGQQWLNAIFILMALRGRKSKLHNIVIQWDMPSYRHVQKWAQNLNTRDATELPIYTSFLFTRSEIFTEMEIHTVVWVTSFFIFYARTC